MTRDTTLSIEKALESIFGETEGLFFVQIGSNDGVIGDPVRELIMDHESWRGIFVEPVPFIFRQLRQNYGNLPRFTFENAAIGVETALKDFHYLSHDSPMFLEGLPPTWKQMGSFRRQHIIKHFGLGVEPHIVSETIETLTLRDLFDRHAVSSIDLIHIDAEGYDFLILMQVDLKKYQPQAILYENVHIGNYERQVAYSLLVDHGYSVVEFGLDTLAYIET